MGMCRVLWRVFGGERVEGGLSGGGGELKRGGGLEWGVKEEGFVFVGGLS